MCGCVVWVLLECFVAIFCLSVFCCATFGVYFCSFKHLAVLFCVFCILLWWFLVCSFHFLLVAGSCIIVFTSLSIALQLSSNGAWQWWMIIKTFLKNSLPTWSLATFSKLSTVFQFSSTTNKCCWRVPGGTIFTCTIIWLTRLYLSRSYSIIFSVQDVTTLMSSWSTHVTSTISIMAQYSGEISNMSTRVVTTVTGSVHSTANVRTMHVFVAVVSYWCCVEQLLFVGRFIINLWMHIF